MRALDRRIKQLDVQIKAAVEASGATLLGIFGVGPVISARILAEVGDIARFATKDRFASYNGTAPIDVSSGDQTRHRRRLTRDLLRGVRWIRRLCRG